MKKYIIAYVCIAVILCGAVIEDCRSIESEDTRCKCYIGAVYSVPLWPMWLSYKAWQKPTTPHKEL